VGREKLAEGAIARGQQDRMRWIFACPVVSPALLPGVFLQLADFFRKRVEMGNL